MSSQRGTESRWALGNLVSSGEVAQALRISRQRLAQLRDGEDFPAPVRSVGRAFLWRWADVEQWLERRRGERPQLETVLEHRLRQLERIGYRVRVGPAPQHHREGDLPMPGEGFVASISMRGWGSVGSRGSHDTMEAALRDALEAFYARADRETGHADRDLEARLWELFRLGWRAKDDGGTSHSTGARYHVYELIPIDGGPSVVGLGESPGEARRQAVEGAEDREFKES